MGVLLKVILFGLVFYYILRTVGGFVLRLLGGQQQPPTHQRHHANTRREGDVHIDYVPDKDKKRGSRSSRKEGDYIDYEELK